MPEDMDWRLQGVENVNPPPEAAGGLQQEHLAGSTSMTLSDAIRLDDGRLLAFPIPNATAMMLNASQRAWVEAQKLLTHEALKYAPRGFVQFSSNADAVDFAEHVSVSIFAAYTALECFANEAIPPWQKFEKPDRKGGTPRIIGKEQIEREVNLGVKLADVLPKVFEIKSPKGSRVWEAFVKLEKVRNRVVHLKYDDRKSGNFHVDTIWKALFGISSPYQTAKALMDYFLGSALHIAGLEFENFRPVRPRWHLECPLNPTE